MLVSHRLLGGQTENPNAKRTDKPLTRGLHSPRSCERPSNAGRRSSGKLLTVSPDML